MNDFLKAMEVPVEPIRGPITRTSFSGIKEFEDCAYAAFLSKVKKFKRLSSEAADRGTAIHDLAENYVKDGGECPKELLKFEADFEHLIRAYREGNVQMEENWGFNKDWEPRTWDADDCELMSKLDVFERESETSARVIDHKTGKKMGNEIKHSDQCMLYAICAFMKYPELEHITCELWYLDKGEKLIKTFTRQRAMVFLERYSARIQAVLTCTDFKPKPSMYNCKWCPHAETGNCEWSAK